MAEERRKIILKGRKVMGGVAEGEALVSKIPLMGWGNVNVKGGFTVERNHPLFEVSFQRKSTGVQRAEGLRGVYGVRKDPAVRHESRRLYLQKRKQPDGLCGHEYESADGDRLGSGSYRSH